MMNTELAAKLLPDDEEVSLRKKASRGAYREFRVAAAQADMTDKAALDAAFKLFAAAIRQGLEQSDGTS